MENIKTIPDKVLKDLDLIQQIYNIQFSVINPDSWIHIVFDENNNHIDGRFIYNMEICSEIELLNIQSYKGEFTQRYENAQNTTLLRNQLSKIRNKAIVVRDFYNKNLSTSGIIATNFYNQSNEIYNNAKLHYDFMKSHQALVLVNEDYFISGVYYGCDHSYLDVDNFVPLPDRYRYVYLGHNILLAEYCQSLIDFVDDLSVIKIDANTQQLVIQQRVLDWLEKETCSCREIRRNNKPFIENANANPLKWLQNRQLLRELVTHPKIKGELKDAEIERQVPLLFIDINNKPLNLAKDKHDPNNPNSSKLSTFLDSL